MTRSETDPVRQIVQTVLYEGYLLWPYRRSALKNQKRWTFGGVHPRPYSVARGEDDPWLRQTQCLVEVEPGTTVDVEVRFLHIVRRDVARLRGSDLEPVPELTVAGTRHLPWEESTEREITLTGLELTALEKEPHRHPVDIPAGRDVEWLTDTSGARVGALVRTWQSIAGEVEVRAEPVQPGLARLTVVVANTTPWEGTNRDEALPRTMISTHVIATAAAGRFVSLLDPPPEFREAAEQCRNIGTWPVLVGVEGDRHRILSSPIILYDYPRIAPESPGDLFDATEIDQLLTLSTIALTEEEKQEARDTDPRAREIVDRCDALTPEQLMRLHGAVREFRPIQVQGGDRDRGR
ncbi:MAG TPA: hypothetical protein VIL00_00850 [Pseudonocardiaceae bacterium]